MHTYDFACVYNFVYKYKNRINEMKGVADRQKQGTV